MGRPSLSTTRKTRILFWGIHGGCSNVGVCTEFVLRVHPQCRTVFAGIVIIPPTVLEALLKEVSEWWKTVKDHEGMLQTLGRDPAGNVSDEYNVGDSADELTTSFEDCILFVLVYNGPEEEGHTIFQRFYDLSE
jgi:hypothetical protein